MNTVPRIRILIIGDEILSGKRTDKHLSRVIDQLTQRGLLLYEARYLGDDPAQITEALRASFATNHIVFSFGGIGATPDDYTRQCAADALGVPLVEHPQAIDEMMAKPGFELTPNRRKMADFPSGADIIPNPYNRIAAFSCGDHYFLPGFPEMAWPMLEWVLETRYRSFFNANPQASESIIISQAGESDLIDMMNHIVARYRNLKLSSLPQHIPGGRLIELSFTGDRIEVPQAMAEAKAEVTRLGFPFENKPA